MAVHFHRHSYLTSDSPGKFTSQGRIINQLHIALLSSALLFSSIAAAQSSDVTTLKNKVKPWQLTEVTLKHDHITIVIPAATVSDETYNAIVSSGVCSPIWTKDVPAHYLKNIKAINVVKKFKASGYSFENPLSVCNEMGKLMDKPAATVMLGNTHVYKDGEKHKQKTPPVRGFYRSLVLVQ